ncbi:MAG: 2-oxo acid dehydrogenase subunit E2 [Deltaproteobacteria bacterium]|nr:2-oxo acid dehydrogenase subunit E2 [Deltaproteobacteria bacterium]
MPTEVKLPELGENVESGQVVRIMVAPGDVIESGQSIIELETDKAAIEVPASAGGTVEAVLVKMGDVVEVGQVLLTLADGAAAAAKPSDGRKPSVTGPRAAEAESSTPSAPPPPAAKPDSEAAVARAEKDAVAVDEDEPSAPASPPARAASKAAPHAAPRAPEPPPVQPPAEPRSAEPGDTEAGGADEASSPVPSRLAPAPPSVRRLARELGLDVNRVPGSGPAGRVSLEDVKAHARRLLTSAPPRAPSPERAATAGGGAVPPLPDFAEWGEIERQPMSNVRRLTAERMSRAWSVIPQVTNFDHADVTELEALRKRFAETHRQRGVRLTLTPIILKAASIALTEMPQLNASIDMERQEIVLKHYRHIAVAVDTDRGLLVPVVRDVDAKGVLALAREVEDLAKRAREKKIQVPELRGASFTVTNLGGIGGSGFSPIVNHPEVAVLGVARGEWTPRFQNGSFVPRLMLPLALSYDHRLVDGADGARFLRRMAALLEDPLCFLLDGA